MYTLYIDSTNVCKDELKISKRPSFPTPIRKFNSYDVSGRDGTLYEDLNTYTDIEVEIEFNYVCNPNKWHDIHRKCKNIFINSIGQELRLSDDLTFYRKIKKAVMNDNVRDSIETGTFSVSFTLDPFCYAEKGKLLYSDKLFINDYETSHPIFFIKGEGVCKLKVNNNEIVANVGQDLVIDTDKMLAYRNNGETQNSKISGNYDDLYFVTGNNFVSITKGFELMIQPNWRCI